MSRKKKAQYRDDTETSFGSNCVVVSEKIASSHATVTRSSSFSIFSGGLNALTSKLSKAPSSPKKSPFKPRPPTPSNLNLNNVSPVNTQPSPVKQKVSHTMSHSSLGRRLSQNVFSALTTQPAPFSPPRSRQDSSSSSSSSSSSNSDSSSSSDSDTDEGERLEEEKIETSRPNNYRLHQENKSSIDLSSVVLEVGVQLTKFSCVSNLMDTIVILASSPGTPPLDAETRVFTADRKCIGVVYETFGPVKQPFYSILFDSPQTIKSAGLKIGQPLYCSPADSQLTQFVFLRDVKKGSDASWIDDREPPFEAIEFSDDETEQMERAQRKAAARPHKQLSSSTKEAGSYLHHTNSPSSSTENHSLHPVPEHQSSQAVSPEAMDVYFLNPNTQNFPLSNQTSPLSPDPYSTNFSTENQVNLIPSDQLTTSPLPQDPNSTNFSAESQVNLIPSDQLTTSPLPPDPNSTNFSTESQVNLIPSEQLTTYPLPPDPNSTNFSTENQVNLIPSDQLTTSPLPPDPNSTNFSTENQVNLIPSDQLTTYPLPPDPNSTNFSTENQVNLIPSDQLTTYPLSPDPNSTNFSTENQVILIPSDQLTTYPLPPDPNSTNFGTESQVDFIPLPEQITSTTHDIAILELQSERIAKEPESHQHT